MLITFYCEVYENVVQLGHIGKQLLIMMGQSGATPGAIMSESVPQALINLQNSLSKEKSVKGGSIEKHENHISLAIRALPLINMLNAAIKQPCNILWK